MDYSEMLKTVMKEMVDDGIDDTEVHDVVACAYEDVMDARYEHDTYDGVFVRGVELWLEENVDTLYVNGRILHAQGNRDYGEKLMKAAALMGEALGLM